LHVAVNPPLLIKVQIKKKFSLMSLCQGPKNNNFSLNVYVNYIKFK